MLFGLAILAGLPNAADQNSLWNWESGRYTPGFQLMEKLDYSRFYPDDRGEGKDTRLISVHIWYPAKKTTRSSMRIKDYVQTDHLPV
jgi:hypothetical protein